MKRIIAIAGATALLVVGTALVVHAQTAQTGPTPISVACADITGGKGTYTLPKAETLTTPATPGVLTWDMTLAEASCPDVQYFVTVYLDGVLETIGGLSAAPPVIASAITTGDGISRLLRFQLELDTNDGEGVCVVASTSAIDSSTATSSKNGAAFDADGSGRVVWDRDPDGPVWGDVATVKGASGYCVPVSVEESPGRTAG